MNTALEEVEGDWGGVREVEAVCEGPCPLQDMKQGLLLQARGNLVGEWMGYTFQKDHFRAV